MASQNKDVPERILYVNVLVAMKSGRILPQSILWSELPIEVRAFFAEIIVRWKQKCL